LVMWPKHQEPATKPEPNICPNVRPLLQKKYPNTMFFRDSCWRSSLKSPCQKPSEIYTYIWTYDQQTQLKCS
jgi:hypothetical protein